MQVEIYQEKKEMTQIDELEHQSWLDDLNQRQSLADRLGLNALAGKCQREGNKAKITAMLPFPLLQGEELAVWQKFLPSTYSEDGKGSHTSGYHPHKLSEYVFDLLPLSVLELWSTLKDEKVFDTYEIWTPERQNVDPVLMGFRKDVGPFMIARWGESLKPFEEIKQEVQSSPSINMNNESLLPNMLNVARQQYRVALNRNLGISFGSGLGS